MNLPRRIFAASLSVLLLLFLGDASNAQQQKAPVDPAALAAARELIAVTNGANQFDRVIDTMLTAMSNQVKQRNPAKAKEITEVFATIGKRLSARKGELMELIAPLYAESLTTAEMQEILRFYRSPVGSKMLAAQAVIAPKSMQIGMAWGQRIGQEIQNESQQELKKRGIEL